jgi:hypothetical protein
MMEKHQMVGGGRSVSAQGTVPRFCLVAPKKYFSLGSTVHETGSSESHCFQMEKVLLGTICSGVMLLVVSFALATPSINAAPEETVLTRLIHPAPAKHIPHTPIIR